jgi:SAM-dependent methyltransferase
MVVRYESASILLKAKAIVIMPVSKTVATQREWEDLANLDPLFAILSDKSKQFGKWSQEEFFVSGQQEIDILMSSCRMPPGDNGRALDFGCGVGRLSKALRSYFSDVYGIDISQKMISLAKENAPVCTFVLNQSDNLRLFQSDFFDFVYSNIVLQHQPTGEVAKAYIGEFVRVIKPKGTIVFQMPYKLSLRNQLQPRRRLYSALKTFGFSATFLYNGLGLNPMRTICLSSEHVEATVFAAGGRMIRSYADQFHGYSMSYVVTKD